MATWPAVFRDCPDELGSHAAHMGLIAAYGYVERPAVAGISLDAAVLLPGLTVPSGSANMILGM